MFVCIGQHFVTPGEPKYGVLTTHSLRGSRVHKYVHKSAVKSDHTFFLLQASDSYGQVSLDRSQIVDVVDQTGRDWWKVSDAMGRQGYYPSHYLKII